MMKNFKAMVLIGLSVGLIVSFSANAKTLVVTEQEYGSKWSYTVSKIELECINNAVIGHTSIGTFNINGKAMGRYKGKYKDGYEISKQYPGIDDPQARMPPPRGLIARGLELC